MSRGQFDLIIRGGTIVNSDAISQGDIGIREGRIEAIETQIDGHGTREIDARHRLVLPGGVDTHCHIEQVSGAGLLNADSFETATRSAAFGGTTMVVSFAAQHPGMRIADVVRDYARLAERGALIDYAFHMIVADLEGCNLTLDLPNLMAEGHRSIKVFTTYDKVRLGDEAILEVLAVAREHTALVCFHAENDGLIRFMTRRLLDRDLAAPKFHAVSHPRAAEIEAFGRMILFGEFVGQPIMLFHVSTREGAALVRAARERGVQVLAETCPHYLLMTAEVLDRPGMEAAKFMCSPPQRTEGDKDALWDALASGELQIVSSDHAPYRFDHTGKLANGAQAPFNRIANGLPGLELRLPLMFDAMVSKGRLGLEKFVALTATMPAEIFGLTGKGRLATDMDADIAIWDPDRVTIFGQNDLHDNVGYNPFAGREIVGWPTTVLSRGEFVVTEGAITGQPGAGRRVPMSKSSAMMPAREPSAEYRAVNRPAAGPRQS